ncbi:MAG: hypothetical protein ACR2KQ_07765 [Actinomycetota bacterium]
MAYSGPNSADEASLDDAMLRIYQHLGKEHGYYATYFLLMLRENGGIRTAQRLLNPMKGWSEGFLKIVELGQLEWTVEALILRPEFRSLFEERWLSEARRRLKSVGFDVDRWETQESNWAHAHAFSHNCYGRAGKPVVFRR